MANVVTYTDFTGENHIAQLSQSPVSDSLERFIDKYEPKLLRRLLGVDMYNDLIAGIFVVPPAPIDQKWIDLIEGADYGSPVSEWVGLKYLIVDYVYYYFQQDYNVHTIQVGVAKPKSENSVAASPVQKMVRAWNEFVDWTCDMHRFIKANADDYPNYVHMDRESICRDYHCGCESKGALYRHRNSFGL